MCQGRGLAVPGTLHEIMIALTRDLRGTRARHGRMPARLARPDRSSTLAARDRPHAHRSRRRNRLCTRHTCRCRLSQWHAPRARHRSPEWLLPGGDCRHRNSRGRLRDRVPTEHPAKPCRDRAGWRIPIGPCWRRLRARRAGLPDVLGAHDDPIRRPRSSSQSPMLPYVVRSSNTWRSRTLLGPVCGSRSWCWLSGACSAGRALRAGQCC